MPKTKAESAASARIKQAGLTDAIARTELRIAMLKDEPGSPSLRNTTLAFESEVLEALVKVQQSGVFFIRCYRSAISPSGRFEANMKDAAGNELLFSTREEAQMVCDSIASRNTTPNLSYKVVEHVV